MAGLAAEGELCLCELHIQSGIYSLQYMNRGNPMVDMVIAHAVVDNQLYLWGHWGGYQHGAR